MGGAKIGEDDQKVLDDLQHLHGEENADEYTLQFDSITQFHCYHCNESFGKIEDRNKHIREKHNEESPILLINGKIKENEHSVEKVLTAEIVLGTNKKNIEISINDTVIDFNSSKIDLIPHLRPGEEKYTIKINQKSYEIFKWTRSVITNPCIDGIIEKWDDQIRNNPLLSPSVVNYPKELNDDEVNYLNGFNNYYLACKKNIKSEDREKRYMDSYRIFSKLKVILPSRARLVLNIIFFRWNWIKTLEKSSINSSGQFDVIVDFFYGRESNQIIENSTVKEEYEVFIEPDIREYLDIIKAFQFGIWSEVDAYLDNWPSEKIEDITDDNKKNRILLLKARRLEVNDMPVEAKKYYKKINCVSIKEVIECCSLNKEGYAIKSK